MKILHIATGFKLSFQGGITNYVRSLAQSQCESGHDVTVIGDPDDKDFPYTYVSQFKGKLPAFYLGNLNDKNKLKELSEYLKENKFDIIHLHMILGLDWDIYKILKDYRYVVSLHDYYYICPRIQMIDKNRKLCSKYDEERCKKCISGLERIRVCRGLNKVACKLLKKENLKMIYVPQSVTRKRYDRFKKLLENADKVFPVSKRVEEIYCKSGIKANYKVLHIGNLSAEMFKENYTINNSNRKIKIGILGSMTYYKGADLVIKIANLLDSSKFEIHFWGRPLKYEESLKKVGVILHGAYMQNE